MSSSKNPKFEEGSSSSSSSSIDRLTSLPESLRLRILSFLPFASAIRTSVLSSQWRHLYKNRAQNLIFLFPPTTVAEADLSIADAPGRRRRRLDSLHLVSRRQSTNLCPHLPLWLALASRRQIQDLTLDLDPSATPIPFSFPSSLTRLTLIRVPLAATPPPLISLMSLETLNLYRIAITSEDLQLVIQGCYVLKTLDIRWCPMLGMVTVPENRPWLRNVTVVDCQNVSGILISSRYLQKFHYCGRVAVYRVDSMLKLEMEDFYMRIHGKAISGLASDDVRLSTDWWAQFGRLWQVKVLSLCSASLRHISASGDFRNFPCLRELQLLMATMSKQNLQDIWSFFKLCFCPGLEKLFIEFSPCKNNLNMEELLNSGVEQPTAGDFANLKTIKMKGFEGRPYQLLLVKFLLWKATCLESLIIVAPRVRLCSFDNSDGECCSHSLHLLRMELDLMVKSSGKAKIVVREHDDHRVRPVHDEIYCFSDENDVMHW